MKQLYDVLIIGGGAVGSAIARETPRYDLKIGVLEKNLDAYYETSGRNSGVVHGELVYDTGSLKAKLCVEGNKIMGQLAKELGFKFIRCGKVSVGNTQEDMGTLKRITEQGEANGASGLELADKERLHKLVPVMVEELVMLSHNDGIADPLNYTTALAEDAHADGVDYYFDHQVTAIERDDDGIYSLTTSYGVFHTRWVVNGAGLGCDHISDLLGVKGYKIIGSKGGYIILDKRTGPLLPMPAYPVPSNTYMGIHVTNTTDGNVIIGPNADTVTNFIYYSVPQGNMDYLTESAPGLWSCIRKQDYIRNYSGTLPKWVDDNGAIQDFRIEIRDEIAPRVINLVGTESLGLAAVVPTVRYTIGLMAERERLEPDSGFQPVCRGITRFEELTKEGQNQPTRENPDYGEAICRCEKVTRAEIFAVTHNPLGVGTMAGTKYRIRSMMGRCQGGHYQMWIVQMIEEELGKKETGVQYAGKGSQMFFGKVRQEAQDMDELMNKNIDTPINQIRTELVDILIVGGSPAGLAAAVQLHHRGIRSILIVEREKQLDGILRQCIHDDFGSIRFKTTLSGPEYVKRFIDEVNELQTPYVTDTAVLEVTDTKLATTVTRNGSRQWKAGAAILIMGCRERIREALGTPGERPTGVFTAGVAQAYINFYDIMLAREVVILGSGDIDMIMARRLILEGTHVQAVFEVQPYPSGPPRSIEQCLNDYNILPCPSHTATATHGNKHLTGATISRVDEHFKPIPGIKREYSCDMLILSVGLIPENELSLDADVTLDGRAKGALVDEYFQINVEGIFATGNILHVHGLADFVSVEAEALADSTAEYIREGTLLDCPVEIRTDRSINHTVPQRVSGTRGFELSMHINRLIKECRIVVRQDGVETAAKKMKKAIPVEMIQMTIDPDKLAAAGDLEVCVEC